MEPIAIIGLSFKLPQGIEDVSSLWDVLENGKNVMTAWPEDRTCIEGFYSADTAQRNRLHSLGGHFFNNRLGEFDAPFFAMNAKEAAAMDPQQHLLLEQSYKALENAGIPLTKVAGTATGVFSGSMSDDYSRIVAKDPDEAAVHAATGQTMAMLANRLSWFFDFKGPSVQVNTACSSSMIAVDLACQSLRSKQSSLALVTGSSIMLGPEMSLYLTNMNVLSPDSLCYCFDHRANGYSRGDGVIVFVLKRFSDAVADGDMIRAVIRASGSNQDGHTPGITQPSITSQEELIRSVYKSCGMGLESTMYVEAHGTGTQLGDASEAKALGRVFKSSRSPRSPLYMGSVKANIGHLEGGSGLAGILKSIIILEKGVIPPNALFEKLNPKINARGLNLKVPSCCIPWPSDGVRRISVNSFGFGGSNGHVVLDDAYHTLLDLGLTGNHQTRVYTATQSQSPGPKDVSEPPSSNDMIDRAQASLATVFQNDTDLTKSPPGHTPTGQLLQTLHHDTGTEVNGNASPSGSLKKTPPCRVLVWTAKDESALKRMTQQHAQYIETQSPDMSRFAYTLAAKRNAFIWRSFAVISTTGTRLPHKIPAIRSHRDPGLAFVFTGQGAQYADMGMELLTYPIFKSAVDRANMAFRELGATWSLYDAIQERDKINQPELSQPLGTALQIALVELFNEFRIVPEAVIGHSSGEIAAAYTVGAISFQSACKIAYHRGRLAAQLAATSLQSGAMMSANLSEGQVQPYLLQHDLAIGDIHIGCVNSPSNVTLSGDEESIDRLKHHLDHDGIFARKLATGVAYHTPAMKAIASEYQFCLRNLERQPSNGNRILMVSSVTGQQLSTGQLSDSQYWVDNLVSPVRFTDALQYLEVAAPHADGLKPVSIYLEIGPSGALRRPVSDTLSSVSTSKNSEYFSVLSRFEPPSISVLNLAGQLFTRGYPVSIQTVNQQNQDANPPFLVDLPDYPFEHSQNYWYETRLSRDWRLREGASAAVLGLRATDWNPLEPRWRSMLSVNDIPWISHHVVGDVPYFPGTGILMTALEAVKQMSQTHQTICGYLVKEITFMSPIVVRPESKTEMITQLRSLQHGHEKLSGRFEVRVFACVDSYWNECSRAVIHVEYAQDLVDEVDGGREARASVQAAAHAHEEARKACVMSVNKRDFYSWHDEQGLKYGQSFSLTQGAAWDGNQRGIGYIDLTSAESFDGIAHPGVLDCAFQVASTATSRGMKDPLPTMIIHKLEDVWIAPTGWQHPESSKIHVLSESKLKTAVPGLDCSFTMLSDDGKLLCRVKKFEMLPAGARDDLIKKSFNDKLFHTISWKAQLSEMDQFHLQEYCRDFRSFIQLTAHEDPRQRVLQIGGASSDIMTHTISILNQSEESTGGTAFSEYLYTETSQAVLDVSRGEFALHDHRDRVRFGIFDMDKDITTQALEQNAYNIIILPRSEAKRNIDPTILESSMRNFRLALKPQGYILVHGFPKLAATNGIGSEQNSTSQGLLTQLEWYQALASAGLSCANFTCTDPDHGEIIISRVFQEVPLMQARSTLVIIDDQQECQMKIASSLMATSQLENAQIMTLEKLPTVAIDETQGKSIIFLADLDGRHLAQMSEVLFKTVQRLIQRTTSLLWVTSDLLHRPDGIRVPFSGLKDGFLRTIRSEYPGKRVISLTLESCEATCSALEDTNHIMHVFRSAFLLAKPEMEYIIRNGTLHTGRLISEANLNKSLETIVGGGSDSIVPSVVQTEPLLAGPPLKVGIGTPGSLETLKLVQDAALDHDLGPTEVEVQAETWGLSFRDAFIALGRLEEDDFGTDCAGVVTRVGPQCKLVKPGDRVCMAALGCMRMFPRALEGAVAKIPDDTDFADACAAVTPAITAWRALVDVARIQKGDKILIHAASGGTGQLALQIAKYFGAEVFATVGYGNKKQLLMDTYAIPEDHIFYSRNTTFAEGVNRLTNGYGVDIVLNSLVGEGLRASWECIAPYGRFIEIGKADIHSNSQLPMAHFAKNVSFAAVDLRHILLHRQDILQRLMLSTMHLLANGNLCPPTPLHRYDISQLEEAMRYFQSGRGTGRVILNLNPSSVVEKHLLVHRKTWSFDSRATYVVAGGLGGIGRSILKWMAEKGAKHLMVPSRSGTMHNHEATRLIEELAREGVLVSAPKCDVSVAKELSRLLHDHSETRPPIKGCINAAMVLNDTVFDTMTFSQWSRTVRSKVQTSWNLHALLPAGLDFFIMLSSISGIVGNPGQSNYAAGCTFQDALAQHRIRTGQKAVAIDLGVVRDIGVLAESEDLQKKLSSGLRESRQITADEVLACLDLYCDPERESVGPSHVTMGLGVPADFVSQGREPPELMQRPLFAAHASPNNGNGSNAAENETDYLALFQQADSVEKRSDVVFTALAKKLARALLIKPEDIDANQPLHVFGVDSLVAMEIKNWIAKEFMAEVAVFELMGGRSVVAICQLVTQMSQVRIKDQS